MGVAVQVERRWVECHEGGKNHCYFKVLITRERCKVSEIIIKQNFSEQ